VQKTGITGRTWHVYLLYMKKTQEGEHQVAYRLSIVIKISDIEWHNDHRHALSLHLLSSLLLLGYQWLI